MQENKLNKTVFFIASPFISLPAILYGIYKKSNYSLILLVVLLGLMSYLYVPNVTNDRARYFELYNEFLYVNFDGFVSYLINSGRSDFLLHLIIFLAAKTAIPVQIIFLGVTIFTVGVWFFIFNKIAEKEKLSRKCYFLCFLLVLFSFSLPDLFSGTRFYFASAFTMLAFYNGIYVKKKYKSIIFLFIALLIHFSSALFIVLYFVLFLFPRKYSLYRIIFLVSLIFLILPKSFVVNLVEVIGLADNYAQKTQLYLQEDDFLETGFKEGSVNNVVVYLMSIGWSFFAYVYLIITIKRKSLLRNMIYLFFGAVNVFYAVPTVYARYLIVLKFVFVLLIIYEVIYYKSLKPMFVTLGLNTVSIIGNIIVLRYIISESYFNYNTLTLFMVFLKKITPQDFLY